MRRWIEAIAKLYPAKWRQRYGDEFQALLADMEPSWRQFFDVLGGALKMQLVAGELPYLKLGALFAVIGMVIAAVVSFAVPRQYTSSAVLRITSKSKSQDAENRDYGLDPAIQIAYSRKSLSEIIQRPELDLYRRQRSLRPLDEVIETMRRDLRVAPISKTASSADGDAEVMIQFVYLDPQKARLVVGAFISRLLEAIASQDAPPNARAQNFEVVDAPKVPTQPVAPNRLAFVAFGFGIGILCGIVATFYLRETRSAVLLTITGLAGCVLAGGLSFLIADRYISTAVIRVLPVTGQTSAEAAAQLERHANQLLSRRSLAELIQRPALNLYPKERSTMPLEDVIQKMKDRDLKLAWIAPGRHADVATSGATAMEVRFQYPDAVKAQAMVTAVTLELTQLSMAGRVEFLDNASLPASPVFPNRYVISALGFISGLLMGGVSLFVFRRRTPAVLA